MSRPTKLTPERTRRICENLMLGLTYDLAAHASGISSCTLSRWRARGREEESGIYHEFNVSVEAAVGQNARKAMAVIAKAAKGGTWQAAAWMMERRHGYVAKKEIKQEITGPGGGAVRINIKMDKYTPDQLRVMMAGDVEEEPEGGSDDG